MNYEFPKFKRKYPESKEEKLISELISDLVATMKGFIRLNKSSLSDLDLFLILRDGSIGFLGLSMELLVPLLLDKSQIKDFTKEARGIFDCYMKQIEEDK